MTEPSISVVMPVFNAERFLALAIESVLSQTIGTFEFLIIDDHSTDGSREIMKKYQAQDHRVKVISGATKGLIGALNQGIGAASGEFIARMDADDVCAPRRFEKQLELMRREEADACGGHFHIINQFGHFLDAVVVPVAPESILVALALSVPFAHGSVMLRRSFVEKHGVRYGAGEHKSAEDYALWVRLHGLGAKFCNVDDWIFSYRRHEISVSQRGRNKVETDRRNISLRFIRHHRDELTKALVSLGGKEVAAREREYMAQVAFILALRYFRFEALLALRALSARVLGLGFYRAARDMFS